MNSILIEPPSGGLGKFSAPSLRAGWACGMLAILCLIMPASSASWRSNVRAGDKAYDKQQYDQALVKYLEALGAQGDSSLIHFDLGNVYQSQDKFPEAGAAFQKTLHSPDPLTRADALYNMGNALVGAEKYPEAAAAYKSALKLHPKQPDYLHNLQLAQALLKRQQQQQQQQQNKDQNKKDQKDQKDQKKQQSDQQQDQNKSEQQKQQEQQQQQKDQQNQNQEQQQQQMAQADSTMSRQDAERLLNALQYNEKQVQENLHRQAATDLGVDKDW
jgi:Ca-activated chloride channel homolog